MSNPKVSVILPVYNGEKFVREAIQSILRQTYEDFEFLIIDDGSTDKSLEIISEFKDPRIRLIRNKKNAGLIFTLNKGIAESKGEFIARMDADDISFPERFEKQVHYLEKHPDVGVCATLMTCNITDRIYKHRFIEPEIVKAALVFTNPIVHPSVMMRRNLLNGKTDFYNTAYPHGEDYALWVSLIPQAKLKVLPDVLISYGAHDDQMSRKFNETTRESVKKAQEMIFDFLGMDVSVEEKQIHSSLFFEEYQKNESYISSVEKWLMKISLANSKKKIFEAEAFSRVIGEWWFRVNQELSLSGFGSYTRFKKSALSKGFLPSAKSIAKLRIKSILKSKK